MIVSTTICTAAHRDDPPWLRHLIINLAKSRGHLVGEGTSDNHAIGLAGTWPENDSEPVQIVASRAGMHHLYGAAGEAKSHGPDGAAAGPVQEIIDLGNHVFACLGDACRR